MGMQVPGPVPKAEISGADTTILLMTPEAAALTPEEQHIINQPRNVRPCHGCQLMRGVVDVGVFEPLFPFKSNILREYLYVIFP